MALMSPALSRLCLCFSPVEEMGPLCVADLKPVEEMGPLCVPPSGGFEASPHDTLG